MKTADMHCDTISRLYHASASGTSDSLLRNSFHLDLEKMQKSGYMLQNFAIFIDLGQEPEPYQTCKKQIVLFQKEILDNSQLISQVRCFSDISKNLQEGRMSALLTLEEGEVCLGNLDILKEFYELGARMMTFTWNYPNSLGCPAEPAGDFHSSGLLNRSVNGLHSPCGLTPLGISFLEEMEFLGMIPDVSHLSDQGILDVCRFARKPFAASHSNARSLCSRSRNLPDELICAIAKRGGIIGVNYYGPFLSDAPDCNGIFYGSVRDTARHIRRIADLGGISCVGLGSDFDGIDDNMELKDCSMLYLLERELKICGFHEREIEAVFFQNVLDFYRELL